jgi:aminoglycoside phosphotransferase (APT) family kinase protein
VVEMARIQALAYNAGLPVPAVYGVKKIDEDKIALEMDYIKSEPFMYDDMNANEREKALDIMANLQCMINGIDASSFDLPAFSKLITAEIKETSYLTNPIKDKVFDLLFRLDTGKTMLCHGDFHSANIVFDGKKHYVIDWDGASTGDPAADVCMTYFYEKRFNPHTADIYLHAYCKNSNITQKDILAWQPVIAAYQVNINTKEQRDFIIDIIDEWYKND